MTFEELEKLLHEMKNALCELCGKYRYEHLGACDNCKWRDM